MDLSVFVTLEELPAVLEIILRTLFGFEPLEARLTFIHINEFNLEELLHIGAPVEVIEGAAHFAWRTIGTGCLGDVLDVNIIHQSIILHVDAWKLREINIHRKMINFVLISPDHNQ